MEDNIVRFPSNGTGQMEQVEQRCLTYLRRAAQPMVAVKALYQHCAREIDPMPLTERELLIFLQTHGEITVMEGMTLDADLPESWFADAGIETGPRAIVNDRMPSQVDMVRMMAAQIADMKQALENARKAALAEGDEARAKTAEEVTKRADALLDKLKYMG